MSHLLISCIFIIMSSRQESLIVKLPMPSKGKAVIREPQCTNPRPEATSTISKQSSSISVPTHILGHFSQSQLAIALTISKSKPEGLSTKGIFSSAESLISLTSLQTIFSNYANMSRPAGLFRGMNFVISILQNSGRINLQDFTKKRKNLRTRSIV